MLTKQRVAAWLTGRFLLRLHMTFILGGTFLAGLAATHVMMIGGLVDNLALRYGVAVCVAYLMFLVLIRLWLRYIGMRDDDSELDLTGDGIDIAGEIAGNWEPPLPPLEGGNFGGAGASGSWGEPMTVAGSETASTSGGSGPSFDIGFDADELIVVVLFLALVVALLFAGVYLIYSAPVILTEAAFEAALVGALARRAKKIDRPGWVGAVSKATAWPFIGILVLAIALGWAVQKACPEATRMRDAFNCRAAQPL
jgi:hypothetical protein